MNHSGNPTQRPTIAAIARQLGLSSTTVSLALRDSPRICDETRERIRHLALQLGYHPDPEVGELLRRLRTERRPTIESSIAALTDIPESAEPETLKEIIEDAREQAAELGFGFTVYRVTSEDLRSHRLQRVLTNQSVEGILMLPMRAHAIDCENWLDWTRFSVVALTRGINSPDFDQIVGHSFWNADTAFRKLSDMGYRRIGFIYDAVFDEATNRTFAAAQACYQAAKRYLAPHALVYGFPSVANGAKSTAPVLCPQRVEQWISSERPDAILFDTERVATELLRHLAPERLEQITIATVSRSAISRYQGIEVSPQTVGAAAVIDLGKKILARVKGPSSPPKVTQIKGRWIATPNESSG